MPHSCSSSVRWETCRHGIHGMGEIHGRRVSEAECRRDISLRSGWIVGPVLSFPRCFPPPLLLFPSHSGSSPRQSGMRVLSGAASSIAEWPKLPVYSPGQLPNRTAPRILYLVSCIVYIGTCFAIVSHPSRLLLFYPYCDVANHRYPPLFPRPNQPKHTQIYAVSPAHPAQLATSPTSRYQVPRYKWPWRFALLLR